MHRNGQMQFQVYLWNYRKIYLLLHCENLQCCIGRFRYLFCII